MQSAEIRRKFIEFFEEKNHKQEPSMPLVPINDTHYFGLTVALQL